MITKKCSSCGEVKPITEFHKRKEGHDGYRNQCKLCRRQWEFNNKEYIKTKAQEYYINNKNKILEQTRTYKQENKELVKERNRRYTQSPAKYFLADRISFCEEVRRDPNNSELLQVKCFQHDCEKWFNPTWIQVWDRIGAVFGERNQGDCHLYCSENCKNSCAIYNQKLYPKYYKPHRESQSREVQPELRELVLEHDNYTCLKCGSTEDLECHHIEGIRWEPLESADIDKCMTVCESCHDAIHQIEGCRYVDMQCTVDFKVGT